MGYRKGCGDKTEMTRALLGVPGNFGDNAGDQGPPWGTGRAVGTTQG